MFQQVLSHLASFVSNARTVSSHAFTAKRSSHTTSKRQQQIIASKTGDRLAPLQFSDLSESLKDIVSQIQPPSESILTDMNRRNQHFNWRENHVSAETFFQNKNGFSQEDLSHFHSDLSPVLPTLARTATKDPLFRKVFTSLISSHHIVQRGFKTRRADKRFGLGSRVKSESVLETVPDFFNNLSDKVKLGKIDPVPQSSTAASTEAPPRLSSNKDEDVEKRINLAFVEGYKAKEESGKKKYGGLRNFFFIALTIWLILQITSSSMSIRSGGTFGLFNGVNYEVNAEDVNVTFNDVKGAAEAKSELQDIVNFLQDPDKYTSLGAKLPKGVLLVGPPGVGKTLLARAVAGEAGVPFFHASGSEFDEMFVGLGAKRIRQLFTSAKQNSPCIIFIDEFDSVGAKRTNSAIHPYANQTINQLLSEMDGFQQNEGIIVLGATNKVDNMDKALRRPGRFDVEVTVSLPDYKGRKEIIELYISKVKKDPNVDVDKLARGTTGFSGAELENLINQAALKAAVDSCETITMDHLEFARDKLIMGPERKHRIPDEETNWLTAYHEAGHALVAFYTKEATPIHKVTIIPRGQSLGHTSFRDEKEVYNRTVSQLKAAMDTAMGGRAAEEVIYGTEKVTTGASSDLQQATQVATAMVTVNGMSEKVGLRAYPGSGEVSPVHREIIDQEIKRLLQDSYDRAKNILRTHNNELHSLAKALIKYETLDKQQIQLVVDGKFK